MSQSLSRAIASCSSIRSRCSPQLPLSKDSILARPKRFGQLFRIIARSRSRRWGLGYPIHVAYDPVARRIVGGRAPVGAVAVEDVDDVIQRGSAAIDELDLEMSPS